MCLASNGEHAFTPPTEEIRSLEQLLISYSFFTEVVICAGFSQRRVYWQQLTLYIWENLNEPK